MNESQDLKPSIVEALCKKVNAGLMTKAYANRYLDRLDSLNTIEITNLHYFLTL